MARFAPVPVPECHTGLDPALVIAQIDDWASSEPMRALVAAFGGGPLPETGALGWLDDFSAVHWNFRRDRVERHEVPPPDLGRDTSALVMEAATALRLVTPAPPRLSRYDHVLVPGGLGRACLQRTHYAAFLLHRHTAPEVAAPPGRTASAASARPERTASAASARPETGGVPEGGAREVTAPEVAALGSYRPLTAAERALPHLGEARTELDAMDVGVRRAFGVAGLARDESSAGRWAVRRYHPAGTGPVVHVLAAPSGEPGRRRADTVDTYRFWAERVRLRAGDRILIVTSPIYVPFQHCAAIRMLALPYGCGVDTVGFDVTRSTALPPVGPTAPDRYLQEIRSAIRAMRALRRALRGGPVPGQKSRYTHGSVRGKSVDSASHAEPGTSPSPRATMSPGDSTP